MLSAQGYTERSADAVPLMTVVAGGLIAVMLVGIAAGIAIAALKEGVGRKTNRPSLMAAGWKSAGLGFFAAAVIGSAGTLFMAGGSVYSLPKAAAEQVAAKTSTTCSQTFEKKVTDMNDARDIVNADYNLSSTMNITINYYPDPAQSCAENTVDSCRLVHVKLLSGVSNMNSNQYNGKNVDEWIAPAGTCSTGDPQ